MGVCRKGFGTRIPDIDHSRSRTAGVSKNSKAGDVEESRALHLHVPRQGRVKGRRLITGEERSKQARLRRSFPPRLRAREAAEGGAFLWVRRCMCRAVY